MTTANGTEPTPIGESLPQATDRLRPATLSAGERAAMDQRRAESEKRRQREDRLRAARGAWVATLQRVGRRYSGATFGTFEGLTPAHRAACATAVRYVASVVSGEAVGSGLLIHGPRGTGKDHLAVAAMRECAAEGFTTAWADGQELFSQMRDSFDGDGEGSVIRQYLAADILLISDPIPMEGKLTEYQQSVLWRIIDRRYRALRMTWVTANCADGKELSDRLGPQLCDRLTDNAVVISTVGLKSYRKPAVVVR